MREKIVLQIDTISAHKGIKMSVLSVLKCATI